MEAKRRRLSSDSGVNPFIDPEGYRRLVADAEQTDRPPRRNRPSPT
jgi:hypothetical protein